MTNAATSCERGTTAGETPSPRSCHALRAFTLMELVLVLVVISVVLALAAPRLRGFFQSRQTSDAAVSMLAMTKWAHTQAMSSGCVCRLNIDPAQGRYWLTMQQAGQFVAPKDEMGLHMSLPEGATVDLRNDAPGADLTYVQFYPSGRCDVATITLRGRQGETYLVSTQSATDPYQVAAP